ncbi:MAG: nucleotidyltransferase family protein [Wenzhouxiangella sp.]
MSAIPGKDDAERLSWLGRHRLWPVADLLLERGLVSPQLAKLAGQLAAPQIQAMRQQTDEERRVVRALLAEGIDVLVLKGALLAQTVYPAPENRFRTDMDLFAEPGQVPKVERALTALGYQKPWAIQSPKELRQSLWERRVGRQSFLIDLHWDLRNHPALQDRFAFDEVMAQSQPLPGLGEGARGMGRVHALLNGSMHYFNDYADQRPSQGLLDKDLLWRAMSADEQEQCMDLACRRGLAGLLAESLARSRGLFATPVSDQQIERLRAAGRDQWATGMVRANEKRHSAYWFALRSEPGLRRKLVRIRSELFPAVRYMRGAYPGGSRFGLLGLYVRRILTKVSGR